MSDPSQPTASLAGEIARITRLLGPDGPENSGPVPVEQDDASPLAILVATFGLSDFERDIVLLCAGVELDGACAAAVARLQDGAPPTFGLALARLPGAHWSALLPTGPLRAWRLIDVGATTSLVGSPLRIDERILHFLTGLSFIDQRLRGIAELVAPGADETPSRKTLAAEIAAMIAASEDNPPAAQLNGHDPAAHREVAAHAAAQCGAALLAVDARGLPESADALDDIQRLIDREYLLSGVFLLLASDDALGADSALDRRIRKFIDGGIAPLILSSPERRPQGARAMIAFDVALAGPDEQLAMWGIALAEAGVGAPEGLASIAFHFTLTAPAIRGVVASAAASGPPTVGALWDRCRVQARPQLDELVQRIEPAAGWDKLVLPAAEIATLRAVADQVRHRAAVHGGWGFASGGERGLGLTLLCAGPSGTGKTLAAEILATELRLDLYRIDLSTVVNKYIGETEKNLRRVFDRAEAAGAILLFDEADALFGKRSEVKDSHDRHANIEVSYLLQRIEAYRGLAILTTNLKESIDPAFFRRLRFVVQFPFPDAKAREEIWRGAFPTQAPLEKVDFARLAQLNVAGGTIRNIALNAAFHAAADGAAIGMRHLRAAAKAEYSKTEKAPTQAEMRGWP